MGLLEKFIDLYFIMNTPVAIMGLIAYPVGLAWTLSLVSMFFGVATCVQFCLETGNKKEKEEEVCLK